jgi:hypothetical protein
MTLHIRINGREHFAAPYCPELVAETASIIRENLPALRQLGRVVVFVTDDCQVAHLIAGSR